MSGRENELWGSHFPDYDPGQDPADRLSRPFRGYQGMKIKMIDFGVTKERCPFRPHENDAGANVYTPFDCTLNPEDIIKIPLGFGIEIPDGFAGYVFPRSSLAVKGLVCELPPIDSGYRGEIHAIISNVSSVRQTIKKDTRIGQLVITPVVIADFVLDFGEERGTGAFGSTGE